MQEEYDIMEINHDYDCTKDDSDFFLFNWTCQAYASKLPGSKKCTTYFELDNEKQNKKSARTSNT